MITACYYVSPLAVTADFDDARTACMANGGDLVVIHDAALNAFILSLAEPDAPPNADVYSQTVWIGMMCPTNCGYGTAWNMANYMNIDGSPINYAPFWTGAFPQPDALVDSCVLLLTDTSFFGPLGTSTGQWQDLYCTSTNRYACVAPAPPAG